jgi:hypothetical protein
MQKVHPGCRLCLGWLYRPWSLRETDWDILWTNYLTLFGSILKFLWSPRCSVCCTMCCRSNLNPEGDGTVALIHHSWQDYSSDNTTATSTSTVDKDKHLSRRTKRMTGHVKSTQHNDKLTDDVTSSLYDSSFLVASMSRSSSNQSLRHSALVESAFQSESECFVCSCVAVFEFVTPNDLGIVARVLSHEVEDDEISHERSIIKTSTRSKETAMCVGAGVGFGGLILMVFIVA